MVLGKDIVLKAQYLSMYNFHMTTMTVQTSLVLYLQIRPIARRLTLLITIILIQELLLYKFDKNSVNWFRNYLINRKQLVKLEHGILSKSMGVKMGVPQGSILGLFLFLIDINDLLYTLRHCDSSITLYADDTILYLDPGYLDPGY